MAAAEAHLSVLVGLVLALYLLMAQQSHYYPAAQVSDLDFWPLMVGFDALEVSGSGNE